MQCPPSHSGLGRASCALGHISYIHPLTWLRCTDQAYHTDTARWDTYSFPAPHSPSFLGVPRGGTMEKGPVGICSGREPWVGRTGSRVPDTPVLHRYQGAHGLAKQRCEQGKDQLTGSSCKGQSRSCNSKERILISPDMSAQEIRGRNHLPHQEKAE